MTSLDAAIREAALEWLSGRCVDCLRPIATTEDWNRCSDGCECARCVSVCWDGPCGNGDGDGLLSSFSVGARWAVAYMSEEVCAGCGCPADSHAGQLYGPLLDGGWWCDKGELAVGIFMRCGFWPHYHKVTRAEWLARNGGAS